MTLASDELPSDDMTGFTVIPVIDLKGGTVVHARAGKRADYRPLISPFGPAEDPVTLARVLLAITGSPSLYVADIDAIEGTGNHFDLCRELSHAFPGTTLWIDAGFSDVSDCAFWLPLGAALVIGSESIRSLEAWHNIRESFGSSVVLSLDFDEDGLRGPVELMAEPSPWPDRLIVMGLGRVGTEGGPDLERLQATLRLAGARAVFAAGGMRDSDDIERAAEAGARGALVATALHTGALTQHGIAALLRRRRSHVEGR
ncbi:MAG: HisA/HisF-related TIM barrel protein [Methyloceanibacter sp.]